MTTTLEERVTALEKAIRDEAGSIRGYTLSGQAEAHLPAIDACARRLLEIAKPSHPDPAGRQASRPKHSFGVRVPEWVEPPVRPVDGGAETGTVGGGKPPLRCDQCGAQPASGIQFNPCPFRDCRGVLRHQESPPRDSGGENAGATMSDAERYAYDKGVEHERHGTGGWHWLSDAEDRAYWRGRESVKEARKHEQREGQAQEAEAQKSTAAQGGAAVGDGGDAENEKKVTSPSPPVEGQAGGREDERIRQMIAHVADVCPDSCDIPHATSHVARACYRFAHSEGAAEAGKRVAGLVEASRALVTVNLMGGKPLQGKLPDAVRAALAEMEKTK